MKGPKISEEKILQNLESSFSEAFQNDEMSRSALLKEMGYDPDKFVAEGLQHINRLIAQQKLELVGKLWAKINELIANYSGKFDDLSGVQLKLRLEQAFKGENAGLQAAFRDFNEACDTDLRSILEDTGILDELNNLGELE